MYRAGNVHFFPPLKAPLLPLRKAEILCLKTIFIDYADTINENPSAAHIHLRGNFLLRTLKAVWLTLFIAEHIGRQTHWKFVPRKAHLLCLAIQTSRSPPARNKLEVFALTWDIILVCTSLLLVLTLDLCDTNSIRFQWKSPCVYSKRISLKLYTELLYKKPYSEGYLPPVPQNARIGMATGGELCTKRPTWEKIQKANLAGSRSRINPPLCMVRFEVLGQRTFLWAHIHSRRLIIRGGYIGLRLVLAITGLFACMNAGEHQKVNVFPTNFDNMDNFYANCFLQLHFSPARSSSASQSNVTIKADHHSTRDHTVMNRNEPLPATQTIAVKIAALSTLGLSAQATFARLEKLFVSISLSWLSFSLDLVSITANVKVNFAF